MESLMTLTQEIIAAQKVHVVPKYITVFTLLNSNSPPSFIMKDKNAYCYSLRFSGNMKACVSCLAEMETFLIQMFYF